MQAGVSTIRCKFPGDAGELDTRREGMWVIGQRTLLCTTRSQPGTPRNAEVQFELGLLLSQYELDCQLRRG